MNATQPSLQYFVERARSLYSLPAVAVKVLELTNGSQVDLRELKQCIENDPAITAKVLRVVNSSLYGLSREVSDLKEALALLGIKPLKLLVLGFSLSEAIFSKYTGRIMVRFWRHSLTKAVAAREIAETVCHIPGDEPFIAALLQDIGMLVLLQELGENYARLLSRPFASQHDLADWEVQSLGFDHTELSARLLADAGLPESVQAAIAVRSLSEQGQAATSTLARILHLSHVLADLLVDSRHDLLAQLLDATAGGFQLTHAQLVDLVANVQAKIGQLADVFSLEMPPGLDYRDVLVQAHTRMAQISADVAGTLMHPQRGEAAVAEEAEMLADVQALSAAVSRVVGPTGWSAGVPNTSSTPTTVKSGSPTHAAGSSPGRIQAPTLTAASPHVIAGTATAPALEGAAALLERLNLVSYACRQSRWPLSLAIVEVDQFPQMVLDQGPQPAAALARKVHELCLQIDAADATCIPLRPYAFGIVLADCDRAQSALLCNHLLQDVRKLAIAGTDAHTVSIGLASIDPPPKHFQPQTLYNGAARCLSSAQLSGGNTCKSIEIY